MIEGRKNPIVIFIIVIILVSFNLNYVFADIKSKTQDPSIIINDFKINNKYGVVLDENKKYLPVSKLKNNLGISINVKDNNFIYLSWSDNFFSFDIKNNTAIVNNKKTSDSFDIIIRENDVYFSLNTIAKLFSYSIEELPEINCIRIISSKNVLSKADIIKKYTKAMDNTVKFAYLTFDDGIDSDITPKVLDVLKEYDIKATFFVLGNTIKSNKEILKRISDEGHSIGNHTYSHKQEIIYTSVENFKKEVEDTSSYIYEVTHKQPTLFRPPYGSKIIKRADYVKALSDYKVVLWNIDSMDSRVRNITSERIANNVIASLKHKKNAIILFHIGRHRENTLNALPKIIEYLKNNNFSIKVIDENTEIKYK